MLGCSTSNGAGQQQVAEEDGTVGSEFRGLVLGLLEKCSIDTKADEIMAGQQATDTTDAAWKNGNSDDTAQIEWLLGSVGAIQETPEEVSLENTPAPASSLDITGPKLVTPSKIPEGVQVVEGHLVIGTRNQESAATESGVQSSEPSILAGNEEQGATQLLIADPQSSIVTKGEEKGATQSSILNPQSSVSIKNEGQGAGEHSILNPQSSILTGGEQSPVESKKGAVGSIPKGEQVIDPTPDSIETQPAPKTPQGQSVVDSKLPESKAVENQKPQVVMQSEPSAGSQPVVTAPTAGRSSQEQANETKVISNNYVRPESVAQSVNAKTVNDSTVTPDPKLEIPTVEPLIRDVLSVEDSGDARSNGSDHGADTPTPQGIGVSIFKMPDTVNLQQTNPQPERAISAKVIDQIVRTAKVQLSEGRSDMTLRLDPPHLGSVQMNVSVADGVVTASLQTTTESAKHILLSDLAGLKQSLSQAGVNIDSINVTVGNSPDQSWNAYSGGHGWSSDGRSNRGGWHIQAQHGLESGPELLTTAGSYVSSGLDYLA